MPLYVKTTRLGGAMRHNFWTADHNTQPYRWPLPQGNEPGAWLDDTNPKPLQPHHAGINLAPFDSVLQYISTENYLAEAEGETATAHDCVVARRVRLLRLLPVTPQQWREIGLEYAQTACDIIERIDHVRPYLEQNAHLIVGPFRAITKAWAAGAPMPQVGPMLENLGKAFEMQISRFKYDIPSSGLYTGPATAASHATKALGVALDLILNPDCKLDHADQVKDIACDVRIAAAALAGDYVEHRGRVDSAQNFAALCGVRLRSHKAPDNFARRVKEALFKRQNNRLREMWDLK